MARPEIRRVEDLQRQKIARVSRFGSATDFGLRLRRRSVPIKRQPRFCRAANGAVSAMFYNALRAGRIGWPRMINAELAIIGRREGFRELRRHRQDGHSVPDLHR